MDQTGSQDWLRLVTIIPERMVCNARENIALIFNNTLPSDGVYRVEFQGRGREKIQVKAQKVNPSTLIVEAPVYNPAEKVRVHVRHVSHEGMISLGSLPFRFISRGNVMANLLQDCADPVMFMCEALGISPCDMVALDKAMTASFKTNMPPGFHLLGLRNNDIGHENSNSLYPTLLHFAAAFGLYHFVKDCLCHCSGFLEAMILRNSKNKQPSEIAYDGQFTNIYELLVTAENGGEDMIYEKMDNDEEEDLYYTSAACHRYINLHLWQKNEEAADDDTDPDGYIKTTRTGYEEDDIYTDMESGCAESGHVIPDDIYADMDSGINQFDDNDDGYIETGNRREYETDELYADMECGEESTDKYYVDVKGTKINEHEDEYQEEMYMNEDELYRSEGQSSSHYQVPSNLPVSRMYPEARSISVSLKNRDEYIPPTTKPSKKQTGGPPAVPTRVKSQEKKDQLRPQPTSTRPTSTISGNSGISVDSGIGGDDESQFMSREELFKNISTKANQKSTEDRSPPPPPRIDYEPQSPPSVHAKPGANRHHERSKTQPVSSSDVNAALGAPFRASSVKDTRPQVTNRATSDLTQTKTRPPAPNPNRRGSDANLRPPAPPPGALARGIPTPFILAGPEAEEPSAPPPPPRIGSKAPTAPTPAPRRNPRN